MKKEMFEKAKEQIIARLDSKPDVLLYLDRKLEQQGIGEAQISIADIINAAKMIKQFLDENESVRKALLTMMLTEEKENSITFDNYDFRKEGH